MRKWALDLYEYHYSYGKAVLVPYALSGVSHRYILVDGSTLSSPSLHIWKVVASSAMDAQIQVLVVYIQTYRYQNGLFGTHWYLQHPVIQEKYSYTRFHPLGIIMSKNLGVNCGEAWALQCTSYTSDLTLIIALCSLLSWKTGYKVGARGYNSIIH